jgi:hypothetical protein
MKWGGEESTEAGTGIRQPGNQGSGDWETFHPDIRVYPSHLWLGIIHPACTT